MLTRTLHQLHRLALLVALVVALVATGFAHRVPAPQDEALAFALANGVPLAEFCGDDLDGDGHRDPNCAACQIAGTADLPAASGGLQDLEFAVLARVTAPRESRATVHRFDLAHAPQGPPAA
jgi:hypothetical protein